MNEDEEGVTGKILVSAEMGKKVMTSEWVWLVLSIHTYIAISR